MIPKNTRAVYKVRSIVETVADTGSFMEIGRHWGRAVATGLARIDGWPVAVIASDPYHYGGSWDRLSAEKYTRFIDLAQLFHLPVLNFVDIPGFRIGLEAAQEGVMRAGVRALTALSQTTVPWCTFISARPSVWLRLRISTGSFCLSLCMAVSAWGSLPIEGGLEVAYRQRSKPPPTAAARDQIEARVRALTSPFRAAKRSWWKTSSTPSTRASSRWNLRTWPRRCAWRAYQFRFRP